MSIYYCIADTVGEEVREGAVAVRSNMDVALPNSAGLYIILETTCTSWHCMTAVTVCMYTCMYIHSSAEFLSGRGWRGLERRLGEGGVVTATEGRRGVASAYSHEHSYS